VTTIGRSRHLIGFTVLAIIAFGCAVAVSAEAEPQQIRLPAAPFHGYRELRTRHFVFIFEPQDREAADKLTSFAEEVYAKLSRFLHSAPDHINCLLIGRTDAANGYFNPLPPHHIGLYLASPDTPVIGARSEDWLRLLFTHELTHYIHLVYDRGFFHALSRVFGGTAASGDGLFLPGWTVEGIAVNTETLFSNGGRGRNPYFELYYRDLILERRMFGLGQAGYDAYGRPEGRVYIAGYLMIDYIITHFGEDAFYRIHNDYVRFPFAGLEPAVKRETGMSLSSIYASLIAELGNRYAGAESLPSGTLESPAQTGDFYLPAVTSDGLFEYRVLPDRKTAIVRVDPVTRSVDTVVTASLTDPESFSVTPDGRTLVFSAFSVDAASAGGPRTVADLYLCDTASGRVTRLTWNAHLVQPAIAPDGSRVVALQRIGLHRRLVEFRLERDSPEGGLRLLYSDRRADLYTPVFSPDGTSIALVRDLDGRQTVVAAPLASLAPMTLPADTPVALQADRDWNSGLLKEVARFHAGEEYYPSFAGSDAVLYTADRGGVLALYEANISTGEVHEVLRDRVGAARGVRYGNGILYETMASTGTAIRYQEGSSLIDSELSASSQPPAGLPAKNQAAVQSAPAGPPAKSTRYANGAPPDFWLPYPTFTSSAARPLEIGPALLTYGANITGTFAWTAYGGFFPGVLQPAGGLQLHLTRGMLGLDYRFSQYYGLDASPYESLSTPVENTTQRLELSLTPLAALELGTSRVLSLSAGVVYSVDRTAPADFSFAEGFDPSKTSGSQALILTGGLGFGSAGPSAPLALYPAGRFHASLSADSMLPALGQAYRGIHFDARLGGSIPSPFRLQSITVSIAASYDTMQIPDYRSVLPPGFTSIRQAGSALDTPGIAMALLRYGFTIASTDLPLPFDSGLAALGASVFAAYSIGFDPGIMALGPSNSGSAAVAGDNRMAAGVDLLFMLARNTVKIPLTVGTALRFDPTFRQAPTFPSDWGFYVSFGTYQLYPGNGALTAARDRFR